MKIHDHLQRIVLLATSRNDIVLAVMLVAIVFMMILPLPTWLVDVLYDHRIKLLISAEVAPELLFTEGSFATEFQRTVSRIVEMQSREYKESERRQSAVAMVRETTD
jgi:hypothetical protein